MAVARDKLGRLLPGSVLGGVKPRSSHVTKLTHAFQGSFSQKKMEAFANKLYEDAMNGDNTARKLIANYCIQKPIVQVEDVTKQPLLDESEQRALLEEFRLPSAN